MANVPKRSWIGRRALLGLAALLAGARSAPARGPIMPAAAPLVGAIRWDAWYGRGSVPTMAMERNLSPPEFRHRLPFFAEGERDAVVIDGNRQEVMDREIRYAAAAGIDYWAFVAYPDEDPMSNGLRLYLGSRHASLVRFCMVIEADRLFAGDRLSLLAEPHVRLLAHPNYQRVLDGRPLYYVGFLTRMLASGEAEGLAAMGRLLSEFRQRCRAAGACDPYVVLMAPADRARHWAVGIGADAVGSYAVAGVMEEPLPYAELVRRAEGNWDALAASGREVVPTVMAGWDRRPRVVNPVPWERRQRPGDGLHRYFEQARPEEIAEHLGHALAWVRAHPSVARAAAVLVYAWNENDEGGWLVPTHPSDDSRIRALRAELCDPEPGEPACTRKPVPSR